MPDFDQDPAGTIASELDRQLEALCGRFEREWKTTTPRLEDFLTGIAGDHHRRAFIELLRVEIELRRARGDELPANTYVERFPEYSDVVAEVFRKSEVMHADTIPRDFTRSKTGLHVRCPHCHNPIELVPDAPLDLVNCPSCGSNFSLTGAEQTTRDAATITRLGQFELIERLGMGAFGTVWKARDTQLQRTVAIKVPRKGELDPEETEKFFREARSAAQLRHSNIVSVHEVGREGDSLFIVSDFIRGVPLSEMIADTRLTFHETAGMLAKVADALHHAHEAGVVHRDLKPQNIMIDDAGEPHLMDFGLAKREAGEITMTLDGAVLGTPAYMSPEQARGESHSAGRTTDIYSLGVLMFQMLTGELPFRGTPRMLIHKVINDEPSSPRKLNANIPKDLETLTLKCLEKAPDKRFQTAHALAADLRRFLKNQPIMARPISRTARAWRWTRRNPTVATLSVGLFASLLAGMAAATMAWLNAESARQKLAESVFSQEQLKAAEVRASNALASAKLEREKSESASLASRKAEQRSQLAALHGFTSQANAILKELQMVRRSPDGPMVRENALKLIREGSGLRRKFYQIMEAMAGSGPEALGEQRHFWNFFDLSLRNEATHWLLMASLRRAKVIELPWPVRPDNLPWSERFPTSSGTATPDGRISVVIDPSGQEIAVIEDDAVRRIQLDPSGTFRADSVGRRAMSAIAIDPDRMRIAVLKHLFQSNHEIEKDQLRIFDLVSGRQEKELLHPGDLFWRSDGPGFFHDPSAVRRHTLCFNLNTLELRGPTETVTWNLKNGAVDVTNADRNAHSNERISGQSYDAVISRMSDAFANAIDGRSTLTDIKIAPKYQADKLFHCWSGEGCDEVCFGGDSASLFFRVRNQLYCHDCRSRITTQSMYSDPAQATNVMQLMPARNGVYTLELVGFTQVTDGFQREELRPMSQGSNGALRLVRWESTFPLEGATGISQRETLDIAAGEDGLVVGSSADSTVRGLRGAQESWTAGYSEILSTAGGGFGRGVPSAFFRSLGEPVVECRILENVIGPRSFNKSMRTSLYSSQTGRHIKTFPAEGVGSAILWDADHRYAVVVASQDKDGSSTKLAVVDVLQDKVLGEFSPSKSKPVECRFSPKNTYLLAQRSTELEVWQLSTMQRLGTIPSPDGMTFDGSWPVVFDDAEERLLLSADLNKITSRNHSNEKPDNKHTSKTSEKTDAPPNSGESRPVATVYRLSPFAKECDLEDPGLAIQWSIPRFVASGAIATGSSEDGRSRDRINTLVRWDIPSGKSVTLKGDKSERVLVGALGDPKQNAILLLWSRLNRSDEASGGDVDLWHFTRKDRVSQFHVPEGQAVSFVGADLVRGYISMAPEDSFEPGDEWRSITAIDWQTGTLTEVGQARRGREASLSPNLSHYDSLFSSRYVEPPTSELIWREASGLAFQSLRNTSRVSLEQTTNSFPSRWILSPKHDTVALMIAPEEMTSGVFRQRQYGEDWRAGLWNTLSGKLLATFPAALGDPVFDRTGRWCATINSRSAEVAIWDCNNGKIKHRFQPPWLKVGLGRNVPSFNIQVDSSGDRLLLTAFGLVALWDAAANRELMREKPYHTGAVNCVGQSARSNLVASGGADGAVILWERTTGKLLRSLIAYSPAITALSFDCKEETLLALSQDGSIRAWDPEGPLRWKYQPAAPNVVTTAIASHPRGPRFAAGMSNGDIVFLDARSGAAIDQWHADNKVVTALAFSDDGKLLACGNEKGDLAIWNVLEKKVASHLNADGRLSALRWLPNSQMVVSASSSVQFWNADQGASVWTLPVADAPLKAMDLDKKHQHLFVVNSRGSILRFDLLAMASLLQSYGLSVPALK